MPKKAKKRKRAKNPEAVEIGKRIRARRQELPGKPGKCMTQEEAAERLKTRHDRKVTDSKWSQWERGENIPHPGTRPYVAEVLQTTPGALFGEPEDDRLRSRLTLVEKRVDAIIHLEGLGDAVETRLRKIQQAERKSTQELDRAARVRTAEQEAEREESGLERELDDDGLRPDSSEQPGEGSEPGSENQ